MNLTEIRQKYPQYDNLSDEQLVIGLHKKYYPQMDFNDFAQRVGYRATPEQMQGILTADTIPAEILAQIDERDKAYDDKSHLGWNVAGSAVTGYGEGIENMTNRFVNGLTFGGYDWLDRHGGNEGQRLNRRIHQNAKNALGTVGDVAISAGDLGAEIGGNIYPGAAITRGLARAGIKSALGQAAAGGGVGGALYGATESDKLSELPVNTIAGGVGGTVTAGALNKAITTAGNIVSPLGRRILERTGSKDFSLPNFIKSLANKDNTKTLQSAGKSGQQNIIEEARVLSDRIKSMYGRNGEVVDSELNNMLKLPQMKKAEEEYAKYIAENGDVILPEGVMNAIYERHPEALIFLQQAKRVNPSRFRNIEPNSIAELNELKEMIGKYVKNPNKSGLQRADALDRARKEINDMMENRVSGYKKINKNYAEAKQAQQRHFEKITRNVNSLANTTQTPFLGNVSTGILSGGIAGGFVHPSWWGVTAGVFGTKAASRALQRKAGEKLAYDIVKPQLKKSLSPFMVALGAKTSDDYISELNDYLRGNIQK